MARSENRLTGLVNAFRGLFSSSFGISHRSVMMPYTTRSPALTETNIRT